MPIPVVCSHCAAKLAAPDNAAGQQMKCPRCDVVIVVPYPQATPVVEPSSSLSRKKWTRFDRKTPLGLGIPSLALGVFALFLTPCCAGVLPRHEIRSNQFCRSGVLSPRMQKVTYYVFRHPNQAFH